MGFEHALEIVNVFEMEFRWEKDIHGDVSWKLRANEKKGKNNYL